MSSKTWFLLASILLTSMPTLFAQTSESELQLGIEAFKENQYEKAINHFDKAVELNSTNTRAHMYLATAYLSQYIPGVDTDENRSQAEGAILHYRQVLDLSTDRDQRLNAANCIAYIYLNMKNWDEARKYYQMASDIAPNDPEPYYSIGVIDSSRCYQPGWRPEPDWACNRTRT
jgi:Flp pilus assembly protein TadD